MKLRLALELALASLWHRRGVLGLVTLTLTLSITLLLGVQYLRTEVRQAFTNTISGTDLIVGARSGQLNLLLYSVFHLGDATSNIRYASYEGLREDDRVNWTVPISLGDSYRGFRVVGTNGDFLEHFRHGQSQSLQLASGQWFADLFEVTLGAEVARRMGHATGDRITLSHGTGSTSFSNHKDHPFTVSGILEPTGTPVDRAVYVSLEGLEAIHLGWQSGVQIPGRGVSAQQAREMELSPDTLTAVLVGVERKVLTFQVQRAINENREEPLTAILPGVALSELWRVLGQFEQALLAITGFVVVISLSGLVAVLLTIQAHRGREIAVLRAVGASPPLISLLYLIECVLLAVVACILALGLGAAAIHLASPWLLETVGLQLPLRNLNRTEWLMLAAVPVAASLVALVPAGRAWRGSLQQRLSGTG